MKNQISQKIKLFSSVVFVFCLLFLPIKNTFAASLIFNSSVADGHVGIHQMFKVDVLLDTEGKTINTLETSIYYPHDLLKLSSIEDGSSFLTMWLQKAQDKDGVISLSGLVPRGFNGSINALEYPKLSPGNVVSFVFEPIKAGTATISASSTTLLLNDGLGTSLPVKYGMVVMTIGDYEHKFTISNSDSIAPDFIYAESHYDAILGGQYIFFAASDKDSGIDHYEIKDGGVWKTVESPYLIKQNRGVYYIKAVDHAGNEKIKEIRVEAYSFNYFESGSWLVFAIIVALLVLFLWRALAKRKE